MLRMGEKWIQSIPVQFPQGQAQQQQTELLELVHSDLADFNNTANAASGMAVHDDCKLKFMELKAKRTYRYIVYKIEEALKQVVVEKLGEPSQGCEDFTANLPTNECRYAVYD